MTTRDQYRKAYHLLRAKNRFRTWKAMCAMLQLGLNGLPPVVVLNAQKSLKARCAFPMWDVEGIADQVAPVEVNREQV